MNRLVRKYLALTHHGPGTFLGWLLFVMLAPPSFVYGMIGRARVGLYRLGLLPSLQSQSPVISVGNLAAGGMGKTPLVDHIVRYLSSQGHRVVVVSRGYGGSVRSRVNRVKQADDSRQAAFLYGDEPALLQKRNPQIEVLTARKRADGIRYATEQLAADVVVLDDGFQHLAARRNLDIVMLDAQQPFGNGWPLPAGELREFADSYRRADLLILSRCTAEDRLPPYFTGPIVRTRHLLESSAVDLCCNQVRLTELQGKQGFAFSGIANPESFFAALQSSGLTLSAGFPLPDHVDYDHALLKRLNRRAEDADFLVTTEKDGVKLSADMFSLPCYQIPLKLEIYDGAEQLDQALDRSVRRGHAMNLNNDLLDILACPKCKGPVTLNAEQTGIVCHACKLVYPVRDDIPVMLIDEATPI